MSSMSIFLCKTLNRVPHLLQTSPYPNLRCLQFLHLTYSTATADSQSFTVSYLINSFSFSPAFASSFSKRVAFHSPEKPDSVISFFKNQGFSNDDISFIIRKCPQVLLSDPNKSLLPKFEFLYSKGASTSEVRNIIAKSPRVLQRSVQRHILPSFDFFKGYLKSNERTIAIMKRHPDIISDVHPNRLHDSIRMLVEVGVPEEKAIISMSCQPRAFSMRLDRFRECLDDVVKMGFDPSKSNFLVAVYYKRALSKSTWLRKLGVYKSWGLSEEQILTGFRRHPCCMVLSEENITSAMDFFVNKLGWEAAAVIKYPVLLSLSLKNRIIPRASVLLFLFENGLTGKAFMSENSYKCSESRFLEKYVHPHLEKVPELSKLYRANVDDGINRS